MYCIYCGKELPDDAKFCPVCGAVIDSAAPADRYGVCEDPAAVSKETKAVVPVDENPYEPYGTPSAVKVMVLGIVALALSQLGIPGIILACIARSNAKKREAAVGPLARQAKVGNILSKVALPVSIAFTIFWTLYMIVLVIFAAHNSYSYHMPYPYL